MRPGTKCIAGYLAIIGFVLFLIFFICAESCGKTIIVAKDGNGDYENIQDAIDNGTEGDTIRVWEGTYSENLVVNKSLTLEGNQSRETTIEVGWFGNGVSISVDGVKLSNFNIKRGGLEDSAIFIASNNNSITNTSISDCYQGISIIGGQNNTISDNTIHNENPYYVDYGMYLSNSNNNILNDNFVMVQKSKGSIGSGVNIWLKDSDNNTIERNICQNSSNGILLSDSRHNDLLDNNCLKNRYGISLQTSGSTTMRRNIMFGNEYNFDISGNSIGHYSPNIDTSNVVNGKPIYFLKNSIGGSIPSDAGFVCVVNSSNVIIEDLTLMNNSQGIVFAFSSNSTISNIIVRSNSKGIFLQNSNDIIVTNVICSNNIEAGIYLQYSNRNMINNNRCSYNSNTGIFLRRSIQNTLNNNQCSNNSEAGISIDGSKQSVLYGNQCSNNAYGIQIVSSPKCDVNNNTCLNNDEAGIFLARSNFCMITNGTCSYNIIAGISLEGSQSCNILNNAIFWNDIGIQVDPKSYFSSANNNEISNNVEYGIKVEDNDSINFEASNNWWGYKSGPHQILDNPNGKGDNITLNVDFDPWLEKAILAGESNDGDEDNSNDIGIIPGFETIIVIGALSILIIAKKWNRRKQD